jgi:hypothetical protein
MFLQIIGSFFAVIAFCFVLGAPPKFRIHAGAIGAAGWALFLVLRDYSDYPIGPATFFAGCLICTCAQILARILMKHTVIMVCLPKYKQIVEDMKMKYAETLDEAIAMAKAQGKGAIALRGKMIDAPIVARAQRTIEMAEQLGLSRREEV